jgi:outer membrane autotransporter protein
MKRSFCGALLAGVSPLAILVFAAGTASADDFTIPADTTQTQYLDGSSGSSNGTINSGTTLTGSDQTRSSVNGVNTVNTINAVNVIPNIGENPISITLQSNATVKGGSTGSTGGNGVDAGCGTTACSIQESSLSVNVSSGALLTGTAPGATHYAGVLLESSLGGSVQISNSGTINATTVVTGISDASYANLTVNNNSGGLLGNSSPYGVTAADFSQSHTAVTFNNSGTIGGKILTSSHGDQINFTGGNLNGVIYGTSGTGATIDFQSGNTTLGGDLGASSSTPGASVASITIDSGATVTNGANTYNTNNSYKVFLTQGGLVNNGTLDLGTGTAIYVAKSASNSNSYTSGAAITGSGTIMTTLGSGSVHGYIVSDGNTSSDLSQMTIAPTVAGHLTTGSTYALVLNYGGSTAAAALPTVVTSNGVTFQVGVTTVSANQTDSDGVDMTQSIGTYRGKDIVLTVLSGGGTSSYIPSSGNLHGVASYSGNDATLTSLSNALNNLTSSASIQQAAAQLRPETTAATTQAATGVVNQALGTIQTRADNVRTAAADESGVASGEVLRGIGSWAQMFGNYADQGTRKGVEGYTAGTWGLAAGADTKVFDRARAGFSLAYARTSVDDSGSRKGSGEDINSYIGTLYGTYTRPKWYVDGTLTYGWHDFAGTRLVNFNGAPGEIAKGSFSGQQYGAKTEFGYPLQVRSATLTPLASLEYAHFHQDGYSESGAGGGDLIVGSSDTNSLRTGLGGKVSAKIGQYGQWDIRPNARAEWLHEFKGDAPEQTSSFVGGGTAFTVPSVKVARDHYDFGIGLDMVSVRDTTLSLKYDAEVSDQYISHSGLLQVRVEF